MSYAHKTFWLAGLNIGLLELCVRFIKRLGSLCLGLGWCGLFAALFNSVAILLAIDTLLTILRLMAGLVALRARYLTLVEEVANGAAYSAFSVGVRVRRWIDLSFF